MRYLTTKEAVRAHALRRISDLKRPSRSSAALELCMSDRTLTRRLAYEGTTYEQVVDELRHMLALEGLARVGVQISEVAYDVGYSCQSSFHHAFKRWESISPTAYRRALHLSPAGWPLPLQHVTLRVTDEQRCR